MYLSGVGAYLPEQVTIEDAIAAGDCDESQRGTGWVGAFVAGDVSAPEMAVEAGQQALERSGHTADDISVLVHVAAGHQGPDSWTPQHYILRHTVNREIPAIGLRQGCEGMLAATEMAACFLLASPERTAALITCADNFGHPLVDRFRSHHGLVLGDAGTATVLSRRGGFAQLLALNSVSAPELEEMSRGGEPLFPPGCTIGAKMDLERRAADYQGSLTPADAGKTAGAAQARTATRTLAEAGVGIGDIARVVHPAAGNEDYLQYFLGPLGLKASQGTLEFGRQSGHLGASDAIAEFHHLVEHKELQAGDHVLMFGVGSGLGLSCAVVRILEQPRWS
ncbi:ketoacyl-ACP synthase III family protein [Streptomyces sp. O3]